MSLLLNKWILKVYKFVLCFNYLSKIQIYKWKKLAFNFIEKYTDTI